MCLLGLGMLAGRIIWTLNSVLTIQTKNTITKRGIRQVVTICLLLSTKTLIASILKVLWQNSVPKDNQEVMLTHGDIKHRTDVLIGRTVTEFQRNNMSSKVFSDRNNFYLSKTDTKEFVSAMKSAFGKLAKELHTISVDDVMTIMGYSISWTNLPNLK